MSRRHSAEKREIIPDPKFGDIVVTIAGLPKRAHVAELILKPTHHDFQ